MILSLRTVFISFIGVFFVWLFYVAHGVLTPFILAGLFAYIFNPVVNFFYHKIKLPRSITIIIIYIILMAIVIASAVALTQQVFQESLDLDHYTKLLVSSATTQVHMMPSWVQPSVLDAISSLQHTSVLDSGLLFSLFPKALSEIVNFLIFLVAAFYFLKDGKLLIDRFLGLIPNPHRIDVEILIRKINTILGGYLRGQFILVIAVAAMLFLCLSILGLRFALIVAIFSGIAELIPVAGPVVAATVAAFIALTNDTAHFGINPLSSALLVLIIYFVVRHLEDYFLIPYVMGKITKLSPLVILFAIVVGGHTWGVLGLIFAVPVAAIIRVLLEFSFDKIHTHKGKHPSDAQGSE